MNQNAGNHVKQVLEAGRSYVWTRVNGVRAVLYPPLIHQRLADRTIQSDTVDAVTGDWFQFNALEDSYATHVVAPVRGDFDSTNPNNDFVNGHQRFVKPLHTMRFSSGGGVPADLRGHEYVIISIDKVANGSDWYDRIKIAAHFGTTINAASYGGVVGESVTFHSNARYRPGSVTLGVREHGGSTYTNLPAPTGSGDEYSMNLLTGALTLNYPTLTTWLTTNLPGVSLFDYRATYDEIVVRPTMTARDIEEPRKCVDHLTCIRTSVAITGEKFHTRRHMFHTTQYLPLTNPWLTTDGPNWYVSSGPHSYGGSSYSIADAFVRTQFGMDYGTLPTLGTPDRSTLILKANTPILIFPDKRLMSLPANAVIVSAVLPITATLISGPNQWAWDFGPPLGTTDETTYTQNIFAGVTRRLSPSLQYCRNAVGGYGSGSLSCRVSDTYNMIWRWLAQNGITPRNSGGAERMNGSYSRIGNGSGSPNFRLLNLFSRHPTWGWRGDCELLPGEDNPTGADATGIFFQEGVPAFTDPYQDPTGSGIWYRHLTTADSGTIDKNVSTEKLSPSKVPTTGEGICAAVGSPDFADYASWDVVDLSDAVGVALDGNEHLLDVTAIIQGIVDAANTTAVADFGIAIGSEEMVAWRNPEVFGETESFSGTNAPAGQTEVYQGFANLQKEFSFSLAVGELRIHVQLPDPPKSPIPFMNGPAVIE